MTSSCTSQPIAREAEWRAVLLLVMPQGHFITTYRCFLQRLNYLLRQRDVFLDGRRDRGARACGSSNAIWGENAVEFLRHT